MVGSFQLRGLVIDQHCRLRGVGDALGRAVPDSPLRCSNPYAGPMCCLRL